MRIAVVMVCAVVATIVYVMIPSAPASGIAVETSAGPVRVDPVAKDLENPWGLAFLPGGQMLVTEQRGRLWLIREDGSRSRVEGLPPIEMIGQGGLMDVVAARDFAETRTVFLTYTAPDGGETRTTLASATLDPERPVLHDLHILLEQEPAISSSRHFGSRVVEAPDGTLWLTIGDRGRRPMAQDTSNTIGKVLRVNRDGSIPEDNPFADGGGHPAIWSWGHRNPQGAALGPEGGLWTVSHGARGGDEINRPEQGKNYGWPEVSYGTHYSGEPFPENEKAGTVQPLHYWVPSIAPSGMMFYSGKLWPDWEGDIFVGALKYKLIARLEREDGDLREAERLFANRFGRIRDVREGPEGAIWFLTDAADGVLYRMTPVE